VEGYITKQYLYNRLEIDDCENKPVIALYVIDVKKIDNEKRENII